MLNVVSNDVQGEIYVTYKKDAQERGTNIKMFSLSRRHVRTGLVVIREGTSLPFKDVIDTSRCNR